MAAPVTLRHTKARANRCSERDEIFEAILEHVAHDALVDGPVAVNQTCRSMRAEVDAGFRHADGIIQRRSHVERQLARRERLRDQPPRDIQ